VVKINRPFVGMFAVLILFLAFWGGWISLSGYLSFYKLNDVVIFSWKVGLFIFGSPLLFYFSYLAILCVIKNKVPVMNNKLANLLALLAMIGAVISLFFSFYVGYSLKDNGYKNCPRKSSNEPTMYVKDIKLC
jgi:hypothetical protein